MSAVADENTSLLEDLLTREELDSLQVYPGYFCCGNCPKLIQLPWRCIQCCSGCGLLCLLYLPMLSLCWLLSCCHGCFCNCCCPTLKGDPPTDQYTKPEKKTKCLSRHSRQFFGCWSLKLMNVAKEKRGCCWRCLYHWVCCLSSVDITVNMAADSSSAWLYEMRSDFGDVIPHWGTVSTCDFDKGVAMISRENVYRDKGDIALGLEVNSVMHSYFTIDEQRKIVFPLLLRGLWDRLRRLEHGSERERQAMLDKFESWIVRRPASIDDEIPLSEIRMLEQRMVYYFMTGASPSVEEIKGIIGPRDGVKLFPNFVSFLCCGYYCSYQLADAFARGLKLLLKQRAFVREIVRDCREQNVPADVVLKQVVALMSVGAGGGVMGLLELCLKKIREDPEKYVPMFEANRFGFVRECARFHPPLPVSLNKTSVKRTYESGGRTVTLSEGDIVGANVLAMNTDMSIYGPDAMLWNDDHVRDTEFRFEKMVSWTGMEAEWDDEDPLTKPVRGCMGRHFSQWLVVFLLDVYKPPLERHDVEEI